MGILITKIGWFRWVVSYIPHLCYAKKEGWTLMIALQILNSYIDFIYSYNFFINSQWTYEGVYDGFNDFTRTYVS